MFLIFTHKTDQASLRVFDLLVEKGIKLKIIHTITLDSIPAIKMEIDSGLVSFFIDNNRIQDIYIRKFPSMNLIQIKNKFCQRFVKAEFYSFLDFLISGEIDGINILGTSQRCTSEINKLKYLYLAPKFKIKTPKTIVTTTYHDIDEALNSGIKFVIKPIQSVDYYSTKSHQFFMYTSILKKSYLKTKDKLFFPTLIQEFIEKDCEIRTFFIKNQFYSYASYSLPKSFEANNIVDSRDYKNLNDSIVNFNLPKNYEKKLSKLLEKLNINTASLDIILSKDLQFYLIDVNPYGIYDLANYYCNYPIDTSILNFFINESK